MDDVTINGTVAASAGIPTHLVVTSVNSGTSPSATEPFSVTVQSQDGTNAPASVVANTNISLSVATGTGTLGGTLTGTILSGTNQIVISGVTYSIPETGVSITVTRTSGDVLTDGTSSTFTVLGATTQLAYVSFPTTGQTNTIVSSFTVEARRGDNSLDLNYTNNVTLSLSIGTGSVSGTLTKPSVAGVSTFNDIQFDTPGTKTLSAVSGSVSGISSSINIAAPQFTAGNIAVFVAASTSANNTTGSIVELNTTTANQSPVNTYNINGTTGGSALRFSGSATSTAYLANSDDRSLLCFTGHNTTSTSGNINTVAARGVGTLSSSFAFNLATTYTGSSGNQTRCATSINNTNWFIGEQGGVYTNGASSASPSGNFRGMKSFGGTVYAQSTAAVPIGTVSAPSGGTLTGLNGLTASGTNLQDFYLVSSSSNTTYDILYLLYTTGIAKYSLVSGSWVANGSYSSLGGFGFAALKQGTGANLYVSTGGGATSANSVVKLFDANGYNNTINITTGNNVTLYTTSATATIKGVAFAPSVSGTPDHLAVTSVNGGNSPSANEPFSVTVQAQDAANAPGNVSVNTNITLSLATGSGVLGGVLTGTIIAGTTSVTFTGITYSIPETGVSITATVTSGDALSLATSAPFTVLGQATQLVFVNFPSVGYVNNAIAPFTIEARRADNSVDMNYSTNVTVSLNSGTGAVSGTLSVAPVNGIAAFNDITFNTAGSKVLAANSGSLNSLSSSVTISTVTLTEDILPQYIQGISGTNNSRIPFAYRVTISGLNANATYKYLNQVDTLISTSVSGAGNIIFRDPSFFYRTTAPSLAGPPLTSYGEFLTDGSGTYSGWFITEPTGNARFTPGKNLYMRITLNDGNGGSSAAIRLNTTNTVHVINFGATANDGTGLRGNSSASPRNLVFLYDNISGTGRPVAGTYVELDGSDNIAIPYIQFYSDDVNDVNGAYGVILPNNLANGIRRIEQRDLTTGAIAGC
ncbi:MAG: hypothetical protein ABI855_04530, partial [Bacteroidota bacterium]